MGNNGKSVQIQPKYEESPRSSMVLTLASFADDITAWGSNVHYRDQQLRAFWPTEPVLASAIYTIISRNAAFDWALEGPPRTVNAVQAILHEADMGRGWLTFITKLSADLFTCDNGAFIEVIRDGNSETSPVVGLAHLDSGRCRRTGVAEWPVVYTDRLGREHKLEPWQVITVEEFPSPIETMNGVQLCAVSRVLRMAQLMRDIGIYKREKVSGNQSKQIHIVSGVRTQEITDAMDAHKSEQSNQGYMRYLKPLMFGTLDPTAAVKVETIDLASLPDGFNEEQAMRQYLTVLSMGFGADYQDFAPLPGGNLGSSAQSQILHQKSRGKGPALFMKLLEHKFNFHGVIPRNVTFRYDEQDVMADLEQAQLAKARADTEALYVDRGVLTPQAVRQRMLDRGDLTQEEFDALSLPQQDLTYEVTATDAEELDNTAPSPNTVQPEEGKAKKRPPDFMNAERLKEEQSLQRDMQKAMTPFFAEIKKRILKGKSKQAGEEIPFADIWTPELRQQFKVAVISALQPHARKGALQAAQYNVGLGLVVNMDMVNNAVLDFTKTYINDWWAKLDQTTEDSLRKALTTWQESGLGERGLPDLVDSIEPLFGPARAQRIATTEVTRIFDEGNRLAHLSAGITTEEWQTSEDELVCPICVPLDGQRFPTDAGPRPVTDTHINCLLPDNEVLVSNLVAGSRAFYSGAALEIRTLAGNNLTVTPNHMVLTPRGFIKAKFLRESDYVISSANAQRIIASINPNDDKCPSRIEDMWRSLVVVEGMIPRIMPTSPVDFYGDAGGFNGDIDVVYSNRFLLGDGSYASFLEQRDGHEFDCRSMAERPFQGKGSPFSFIDGSLSPLNFGMSRRGQQTPFLSRQSRHSDNIRLTTSSRGYTGVKKAFPNDLAVNAVSSRQRQLGITGDVFRDHNRGDDNCAVKASNVALVEKSVEDICCYPELSKKILNAFPGLITADQIVGIRDFYFSGHVYDLQSLEQFYICNRVIVKNCRCARLPVANDEVLG